MKTNNHVKNLLLLHLVVFTYGFTGVLGKLINIDPVVLVWYRVGIGLISVAIYLCIIKHSLKVPLKKILKFFFSGFIIACHWITFYWAIKVSNVSITLATLSSATLFTAFFDPLFRRKKIKSYEMILGLFIVGGLALIFKVDPKYHLGIIIALAAAILSSIFTVINGRFIEHSDAKDITFYELLGGIVGISIFLILYNGYSDVFTISAINWLYILILGIICTGFAFIASTEVMRTISPFSLVITINLEPIYGIILAYLIFRRSEVMNASFYLGTVIILASIFINSILKVKDRKNATKKEVLEKTNTSLLFRADEGTRTPKP